MITENVSTLKIHKLTQAQYDRELATGNIDDNAIYLTPDEGSNVVIENRALSSTTITESWDTASFTLADNKKLEDIFKLIIPYGLQGGSIIAERMSYSDNMVTMKILGINLDVPTGADQYLNLLFGEIEITIRDDGRVHVRLKTLWSQSLGVAEASRISSISLSSTNTSIAVYYK